MMKMQAIKKTSGNNQLGYFRYAARGVLVLIAAALIIFGLLPGIKGYGAFPILILFGFVYIAWSWEEVGGILIALSGIWSVFMFIAIQKPLLIPLISLPLAMIGGLLFYCGMKDKTKTMR